MRLPRYVVDFVPTVKLEDVIVPNENVKRW